MTGKLHSFLLLASLSIPAGCGGGGGEEDVGDEIGDDGTPNDECLSGISWAGGNSESSRMHPGMDCIGCHQDIGEAEQVILAGTVYDGSNELDDCYGVEGVTVQLTDSTNQVIETTTNQAGNFLLIDENATITPPYSAKLLYEGRERMMVTMQTELSCNSCHTETGANAAPGRILAP